MARDFDPSASQQRAINVFGLTFDGTHAGAKAVLTAAGLTENGIPSGLSPVAARKLSDDELRAAFGVEVADASTASAEAAERLATERTRSAEERERLRRIYNPTMGERRRATRERDEQNARLRAAGYTWDRELVQDSPSPLMDDWSESWVLRAPDGREITVRDALAELAAK